jgi:hypothetical protein
MEGGGRDRTVPGRAGGELATCEQAGAGSASVPSPVPAGAPPVADQQIINSLALHFLFFIRRILRTSTNVLFIQSRILEQGDWYLNVFIVLCSPHLEFFFHT